MRDKHDPRLARRRRKPPLKVVVRRLPAHLPEAVFWRAVAPWVRRAPEDANVSFAEYCPGKLPSAPHKRERTSTAYIRFTDPADVGAFIRGFDGHILRDRHGHEYTARVEIALYQTVASAAPARRDPLHATAHESPEFRAFAATLDAPPEPAQPPPGTDAPPADKPTPLVAYVNKTRNEHARARDRQPRGHPTILRPPRPDAAAPAPPPAPRGGYRRGRARGRRGGT